MCVTHCVRNSRNVSAKSIGVFLFKRPSGAQCDVNALRNLLRKKERKTKKTLFFHQQREPTPGGNDTKLVRYTDIAVGTH